MTQKRARKQSLSSIVDPLSDGVGQSGKTESPRTAPKNGRRAVEYVTTNIRSNARMIMPGTYELFNCDKEVTISKLKEMLDRDGQVASAYRAITSPLKNLGYSIRRWEDRYADPEPPKPPKPPVLDETTGILMPAPPDIKPPDLRGKEEADFIQRLFTEPLVAGGMRTSFRQFISEILLSLRDGFACFEKVWRIQDGKWLIDRFAYIPSEECRFVVDDTKQLHSVRQYRTSKMGKKSNTTYEELPPDKIFLYTLDHADNPFYGKGILHPAYYHYDKKHKLYYIMHLAYALNAIAARIGKYPRRASEKEINDFLTQLDDFGTNTAIVIPDGYTLEAFQQTRGLVDLMPAVTHHDQQICKSMLPHMIGVGIQPTPIGDNAGFLKLFEIYLNGIMADIADAINRHVIPELIQYNFGTEYYPTISFDNIPVDRIALAQEVFTRLISTKSVAPSAEFLMGLERLLAERVGLIIDYNSKQVDQFKPPDLNTNTLPGVGRPKKGENDPISTDPAERSKQDTQRTQNSSDAAVQAFADNCIAILRARAEQLKGTES